MAPQAAAIIQGIFALHFVLCSQGSDSPGVFCPLDQLVEGEGGR